MRFLIPILGLLISAPAFANVGIPVVAFGWPFMLANLLFVVLIEVFVLRKLRPELGWGRAGKHVLIANLFTTLIGYPLVAVIEGLSPALNLNIGWLLPFPGLERMHGYVGIMMLLTLIPCYFLSAWFEGKWLRRKLSRAIQWRHMYLIHLASYAFLIAQVFGRFPMPLLKYGAFTYEWAYVAVMSVVALFTGQL